MAQDPEQLRIGTAEREEATQVLSEHFSAGRLTIAEYDERVGALVAAQTRAEVRTQFEDLPAPHPAFLAPPLPTMPPMSRHPERDPRPGAEMVTYSEKSKLVAGLLQLLLPFGVGRFYTGHTGVAVAQLFVTIVTLGMGAVWSFIDGIILLASGGVDGKGRRLRE
ncbi:DUF1707 domain-containing protein [Saccharomonospora sp. CUA-673]|uniref:DUF1707 domain-containing protein n=1 Tax=Saccharomonospora sp. CUA-673 TaxID=1904969 RepID=UPI0009FA8549|nr:DUF1707 domain-containing protein [Saccharomonospora sp. CUA-673]